MVEKICMAVFYLTTSGEQWPKDQSGQKIEFSNKETAIACLNDAEKMTLNQRIALFSYVFLYSKINKLDETILMLKKYLKISNEIESNVKSVFCEDKTNYIANLYNNENKNLTDIFTNPDWFIVSAIEEIVHMPLVEEKIILKSLKIDEYEHVWDKQATTLLKEHKSFKDGLRLYNEFKNERQSEIEKKASLFKVTKKNIPELYNIFEKTCHVLNMNRIPELFIDDGGINAYTSGTQNPLVVINSGCLSLLTTDELIYIMGHELGHIKSSHILYDQIFYWMLKGLTSAGKLVMGSSGASLLKLATKGLLLLFVERMRKSELTADRAGLLACQNPDAVFTAMTKMLGFPHKYYHKLDKQFILEQAKEFDELDMSVFNKVEKFIAEKSGEDEHPWMIMRAKEIDKWISSGEYDAIISKRKKEKSEYADYIEHSDKSIKIRI